MAIYVLQSFLRQSSIICLNGSGCEIVRKSPIAYPFGIPVPTFGLVGYTILAITAFLRTAGEKKWMLPLMKGVAIFGVCFVTWFTFMEIFVIKGICTWCATSAITMYIVAVLLFAIKDKKSQVNNATL